jgi:hypothetical protein
LRVDSESSIFDASSDALFAFSNAYADYVTKGYTCH